MTQSFRMGGSNDYVWVDLRNAVAPSTSGAAAIGIAWWANTYGPLRALFHRGPNAKSVMYWDDTNNVSWWPTGYDDGAWQYVMNELGATTFWFGAGYNPAYGVNADGDPMMLNASQAAANTAQLNVLIRAAQTGNYTGTLYTTNPDSSFDFAASVLLPAAIAAVGYISGGFGVNEVMNNLLPGSPPVDLPPAPVEPAPYVPAEVPPITQAPPAPPMPPAIEYVPPPPLPEYVPPLTLPDLSVQQIVQGATLGARVLTMLADPTPAPAPTARPPLTTSSPLPVIRAPVSPTARTPTPGPLGPIIDLLSPTLPATGAPDPLALGVTPAETSRLLLYGLGALLAVKLLKR